MTKDELVDLVNRNDRVIGKVLVSEAHKDPSKIHREVAIAVFNNKGEVLIQQRSLLKKNDPGEWKISAAGHVGAGEKPKIAAERELLEELGIKVNAIFYRKIFKKRLKDTGNRESRFIYMHYAIIEGKPVSKLDETEVMNAIWIEPKMLNEFAKKEKWDINGLSHKTIIELKKMLNI